MTLAMVGTCDWRAHSKKKQDCFRKELGKVREFTKDLTGWMVITKFRKGDFYEVQCFYETCGKSRMCRMSRKNVRRNGDR